MNPVPTGPRIDLPIQEKGDQDPKRAIKGRSTRKRLQWEREGDQDLTVQFGSSSGVGLKRDLIALVD